MHTDTTDRRDLTDKQIIDQLLLSAGGTSLAQLSGRLSSCASLFDIDPCTEIPQRQDGAEPPGGVFDQPVWQSLTPDQLTAFAFAFNNLSNPVKIPRRPPAKDILPAYVAWGIGNLHSGSFTLPALYGKNGVSGDISAVLERCLVSPWDPAKLQLDRTGESGASDVLRVHNLIAQRGASLDEDWFAALPDLNKALYFDQGDVCLHRAVIPDLRNDQTLLLSQFQSAMARCHNRAVDLLRQPLSDSFELFQRARRCIEALFARVLLQDVLPRLLDPVVLHWCLAGGAQLYRRTAEIAGTRFFLPIEACTIVPGLIALHQPTTLRPNPASGEVLRSRQMVASIPFSGLPAELFVSRNVPTRLRKSCLVDWQSLSDETATTHARIELTYVSQRTVASTDVVKAPAGQTCVRAANRLTGLNLPLVEVPQSGSTVGEMSLLPYVVAEAREIGKQGRLGPLGSLIIAETIVGAISATMPNSVDSNDQVTLAEMLSLAGRAPMVAQ